MISTSRAGVRCSSAKRGRRCSVQSGTVDSCDEIHGVDEGLPGIPLTQQRAAALSSQTIKAAAALSGLFHPASLQPPTLLETIQKRIQRRDIELQLPGRLCLDQFADLVSMTSTRFDD